VRALKAHSGICRVVPGKPLDECLTKENIPALEQGLCNLEKQIENIKFFGIPVVVAVNRFATDTDKEIDFVKKKAVELGADDCQESRVWREGSKGGVDLAKSVLAAAGRPKKFQFLYPSTISIKEKIKTIAVKIYGAKDVEYSDTAEAKIKLFTERGWDNLPICMAKTHLSLCHDPNLKGRPRDFILPIRDIRASIGAGFLYPLCGTMQTMPGLPTHPVGENIDIDEKGNIIGLS
jgi:formyltetrahydrofolate synthetase